MIDINDREFGALLDWFMCSGPWPVVLQGDDSQDLMRAWLNRLAKSRGYTDWVDAFRRTPGVAPGSPTQAVVTTEVRRERSAH